MDKHVVVLFGGLSPEREVSLVTGKTIVKALQELGYMVTPIDAGFDLAEKLIELKPDVVFNALHGTYGEDGAIAGLLESMNIPYTHSGVLASAIAMDKEKTKSLLEVHGIRSPKAKVFSIFELKLMLSKKEKPMAQSFVMKPVKEGSSVGLVIAEDSDKWSLHKNWKEGSKILAEEYIPGKEISVAVLKDKALGVLELRPKSGIYDYDSKYTNGMTEHIFPADIPEAIYKQAMRWAEEAHSIIGCRTVSRSDFRYNPEYGIKGLYFLEINTHPGFTPLSIVPEIAMECGLEFNELVKIILADAKCDMG